MMMLKISDFDDFLVQFRVHCKYSELEYLTDLAFLPALPQERGTEKRFMGGLLLWCMWATVKCCALRHKVCAPSQSNHHKISHAFFILPTDAHQGSLRPIFDEIDPEYVSFYGQSPDSRPGAPFIDCSLEANLEFLSIGNRLIALSHALVNSFRIMRIVRRIPHFLKRANSDYFSRLSEFFFRMEVAHLRLSESPSTHRAVFVTYEVVPECKAIVKWALQAGTRVIHVMHGQRLSTYQITRATDLVLLGKPDEDWFRTRVPVSTRIWSIGHPRLEWVGRQVGPVADYRGTRRPRIAFFSQPAEKDYTRDMRLDDWRILIGLKIRADVRLRLHPREDRSAAIADLREIGLDFVKLSDSGLVEDLAWCDGIASSWSTVSVEAAACGRAVFWTCATPELYESPQLLRDVGIGVLLRTAADWNQWLDRFREGGWPEPAGISEDTVRNLGFVGESDRGWLERLGIA